MVFSQNRHFLQSHEWALFQQSLGKTVVEREGDGWRYLAILEKGDGHIGRFFKRLYCPYGPSYNSPQALEQALNDLEKTAKKYAVDYVRIEPVEQLQGANVTKVKGYTKASHDFQPALTLIVDLDRSFEDIKKDMHRTSRYRWNRIVRDEITFSISHDSKDVAAFIGMMEETSGRTQATFRDGEYYKALLEVLGPQKVAGIAYAHHQDEILVGVLFIDDIEAKTRYYLYTGSFDKARQYGANAPLVVFLLKDSQEKKLHFFDFFGLAPAGAKDHRWAGFSAFKRSFGGEERAFIGTWEKPIRRMRYTLMSLARKFA